MSSNKGKIRRATRATGSATAVHEKIMHVK